MQQRKPKLEVKNPRLSPVIEISDFDEKMVYLVGWPGYRTSRNKSGLGYIETQAELARMEILMLKWLVTGRFRTHNPIYLLTMFAFGLLVGVIPAIGIIVEIFNSGNFAILRALIPAYPYMAVGIALVINTLLNILDWDGESITGD